MNNIESKMCPLCYAVENVKIDGAITECPFCGNFYSDVSSRYLLADCPEEFDDDWRLKTRHVVKKRYLESLKSGKTGLYEDLREPRLKEIDENYFVPELLDKANLVLEYLVQETNFFGDELRINVDTLFPLFYCKNNAELYNILNFLSESGLCSISDEKLFIEPRSAKHPEKHYMYNYNISDEIYKTHRKYLLYSLLSIVVTSKGIERVENQALSSASKQAFVAMWFNDKEKLNICHYDMQKVYKNAIEPAISTAEGKYTAMRIDYKEHCNDINDEMIAEIRKSKFVVADLTGYRGGVYFEAGFAYGLGLPVIYTCNREWQDTKKDNSGNIIREGVHFDLNHRNIIFWDYDKLDEFKDALRKRIEAVIV